MPDRLVAVNDADYRLPEPIRQSLAADVAQPESELGGALLGSYISASVISGAGIDPTGVSDSTAAMQAVIDAATPGSTVHFPPGTYRHTASLTVNKPLTITGRGATLIQSTSGVSGIEITSGDVHLVGLELVGSQSAAYNSAERAVKFTGTLAAYLPRVSVRECIIHGWGHSGISATFVSGFDFAQNVIHDVVYVGIGVVSGNDGNIALNRVRDVNMAGAVNAYGIFATHNDALGTSLSPRSQRVAIDGNRVENVPWEGIDTHAGIEISATNNTLINCRVGVAFVGGQDGGVPVVLAPIDAKIIGNTVIGSSSAGISLTGASTALGFHNVLEFATGVIASNTMIDCGFSGANTGSALWIRDTLGVNVVGNRFERPAVSAIRVDYNNKDATLTANTAVDVWTDAASYAAMIQTTSGWNTLKMTANTLVRGSRVASFVNTNGLRLGSGTATLVVEASNDFQSASTPITGTGATTGRVQFENRGIRCAYVGSAVPGFGVWQRGSQLVSTVVSPGGVPGWVCTTAGGVSSAAWAPSTSYGVNTWIRTSTGKVLESVSGGTSHATTEPNPTVIDGVVTDGSVTWVYRSPTVAVFSAMPALAP